ncbi:MASE1 domain-containing protein [Achromobacter seleniivolatilans]|uniref:MASE1 domain-containing protein n=1 Tax=Achromobacter seleniivolatilans TaxID=3047478 RepID=A0ABY9M3L4_9BURK|nr:MASE1 domain-containing protein [Achromobacter sp. R39]WMD20432.1 MASE1 domain-containing protein [Achromobacter sp. R39]
MATTGTPNRNPLCLLWAIPYLLCGVFSHLLNDPVSHALFVWLPPGVAVGAYLLSARRNWPLMLLGFFCAQLILTLLWRGQPLTAIFLAVTGSLSSLLAAWTVQRLSPRPEGLGFVAALLAGAVVGAASSAIVGGGWLWLAQEPNAVFRLRTWVSAYLAGVLILAPALTGWAQFRPRRSGGPGMRDLLLGAVAYVLMIVSTFMTFDGDMIQNLPYVVSFELTYLPLVFAVLIALVWGTPGGTLAMVTLMLMALYQSAQGEGPFVEASDPWHVLLATQVYLVVTALLLLLVNTLRGARAQALETADQWRGRFDLALAGSHQLMYRYNPYDGSLELAGDLQEAFGIAAGAITDLDSLLAHAHPDDRARLSLHWAARRAGAQDRTPLLFRVAHSSGGWRLVSDRGSPLADFDGSVAVVAGMWRLGEIEHESAHA